MVKQTPWSKYTPEQQRKLAIALSTFTDKLYSDSNPRSGILKRRNMRTHKRHELFHHQPVAAQRLLKRDHDKPWATRNASMLAIHEVGTGKTITAILAAAATLIMPTDREHKPRPTNKILIICPKSVLRVWYETLLEWTELGGDKILFAAEQAKVGIAQVKDATIILTTPDVLTTAWKTFMYQAKGEEVKGKKRELRWVLGVDPKNTKRIAELGGMVPPVHPLFLPLVEAKEGVPPFLLTVVDEVHTVGDRTKQKGHVIRKFTTQSVYKLGLTGTPVQAKPDDLAALAQVLNAQPKELQEKRFYTLRGDEDRSLNKPNIKQFHELLVDRVDVSFLNLPKREVVTLVYDPWVGLTRPSTGLTMDPAAVENHNALLKEAQRVYESVQGSKEATEDTNSQLFAAQNKVFTATIRLGQYEFSPLLGMHGASGSGGFDVNPHLFDEAAAAPSQVMILVERIILDRQKACHPRIAVFCEHVTELKIMRRYLEMQGSQGSAVGELFFFDSNLSANARKDMIDRFLKCNKGVFFFSAAGSVGITLCPGCEVLLSIGPLPWNPTTIDQAFGRVYRIGQQRPVEIIQFVARRSVTSVKLRLHDDKRNRLGKAAADEDYSYFDEADENKWRFTQRILTECLPLNAYGNYEMSPERKYEMQQLQAATRRWEMAKEQADANGVAPPPQPIFSNELKEEAAPAIRPDSVPLPPVSFPC
tara:strand:- start:158 stop:2269 length:2112 start_codon:yes stop_codon:yes gene_type:complete